MKPYYDYLNTLRPIIPGLNHSLKHFHFTIHRVDSSRIYYDIHPHDNLLHMIKNEGSLALANMYLATQFLKNGPKILNVNDEYAAAFINTDINVELPDYDQPFPTMFVMLPKQFGESFMTKEKRQKPEMVLVHHDKSATSMIISVQFSDGQRVTCLIHKDHSIDQQLDEVLPTEYDGSIGITDEEKVICKIAYRVAINALLLADGNYEQKGPHNADHLAKLKSYVSRAKSQEKREQAELECHLHPYLFEFEQTVQTYSRSKSDQESDNNGTKKRPHWRRGHYRQQKVGEGRTDTRRVRIPPILVNADLYIGEVLDAKAIYELNTPIQAKSSTVCDTQATPS